MRGGNVEKPVWRGDMMMALSLVWQWLLWSEHTDGLLGERQAGSLRTHLYWVGSGVLASPTPPPAPPPRQ